MGYGDSYDNNDSDSIRGPQIPEGTYRARGVPGSIQLGTTDNGNPQVAASFELLDETHAGKSVPWYGYFTDKTQKRTLEALRIAGWSNDDLDNIEGFGDTEVDIVVEHNEWEGKVRARVAWVNRPGSGGLALKTPMNDGQRKAFAAKMKGLAVLSRREAEREKPKAAPTTRTAPKRVAAGGGAEGFPPAADDDIPF
jgi:hypothetical protein